MKMNGTILEKATMPDGSASITVETETGARFEQKLDREFARSGFQAGEGVTMTFSQSAKQKKEVADTNTQVESDETARLMGGVSNDGEDGGSAAKNATKPMTDESAIAGTSGGSSSESDLTSANKSTKLK